MPELPEVEVVRRGLDAHVVGRVIESVTVAHPRAVRRHLPGPADLAAALAGARVIAARRRGKYLWLDLRSRSDADTVVPVHPAPTVDSSPLNAPISYIPTADVTAPDADLALVVHLGMSGQMLVCDPSTPDPIHLRVRARLDNGRELRFVDQRTFGGWFLDDLVPTGPFPAGLAPDDVVPAGAGPTFACASHRAERVPSTIAHIGRDPFDPRFDRDAVVARWRSKHTEIKRALLDQTVVSGIGNIYADEALWLARLHGTRLTDGIAARKLRELLDAAREVMERALAKGGTSFDSLYVNVNGASGYFARSLNAYGREGLPCPRCGRMMRREQFMNRSSFSCPRCQPRPAVAR